MLHTCKNYEGKKWDKKYVDGNFLARKNAWRNSSHAKIIIDEEMRRRQIIQRKNARRNYGCTKTVLDGK